METTWGLSEHGWLASSAFGHSGDRDMPHSLRFVFPRIMAHAWRSFDMIVDSVLYLAPTRACEPAFYVHFICCDEGTFDYEGDSVERWEMLDFLNLKVMKK
jgi:hypothetical protein